MKTFKMKMLPLLFMATIGLLFPACDGNNPDDDLVGVTTLKMRSGNNSGYWDDDGGATDISFSTPWGYNKLFINNANNFIAIGYYGGCAIVDMGKKKLSQIQSVPSIGWTDETAVLVGHGYIYRYTYDSNPYKYIKVYVVDYITGTSGGIIGAEVKYCEWDPNN